MPTADDVASKHRYLAQARPDWRRSMSQIKRDGGPWYCKTCGTASLLIYRCSACGAELNDSATTNAVR